MSIRHRFVCPIPDEAVAVSAGRVVPSNWNDAHEIPGYTFVSSIDDFPAAVGGVITLEDNETYLVTGVVDLMGARLVGGQNTTILGGSSENSRLQSTGLTSQPLITSSYSLPLRSISITAAIALSIDGGGTAALDWFGVNFLDCPVVGTIKNVTNVVITDSGLINSAGLTFDGTIGTVAFASSLIDSATGGTAITIAPTAAITRRFRCIYCAFIATPGETALDVSTSATVPVEGYILDTVNFSGGGTYTAGVQFNDNKSLFSNNRGINNSASIGYYTMQANATATVIAAQSVPVKIAGTTVASAITQRFTHTSNRLTYTGALPRTFKASVTGTLTASSGGQQLGMYIAKNGVVITESRNSATTSAANRAENVKAQTILDLVTGDYVEVWCENASAAANVTCESLSHIIEALN